jgi:hypothetical protein
VRILGFSAFTVVCFTKYFCHKFAVLFYFCHDRHFENMNIGVLIFRLVYAILGLQVDKSL